MTCIHGFLALAVASATCGMTFVAHAEEVATLIRRCDVAVASAKDAEKSRDEEVFFDQKIDPTVAVPVCEAAAKAAPYDGRIAFELGLAYDYEEQPRAPRKSKDELLQSDPAPVVGPGPQASAQYFKAAKRGSPSLRELLWRRLNYRYFPKERSGRRDAGFPQRPYFLISSSCSLCF